MNAYVVDGVRTPIGKYGGSLAHVRADDLAATPIIELLQRLPGLTPELIADTLIGCANQAGEDNRNVGRFAALLAGLPVNVPGQTINRLCGSGMSAVIGAAHALNSAEGDFFVAGGVEQMTRAPFILPKTATPFERNPQVYDTTLGWRFINQAFKNRYGVDSMGETAENLAEKFQLSREAQDQFALASQTKVASAVAAGRFDEELCPVEIRIPGKDPVTFSQDEFPRAGSTIEALAKLKPAFRHDGKGSVTAGNSSGINDGAAALLIASEAAMKRANLKPKARIVSSAVTGVEPRLMGLGPVPATRLALERAGLSLDQIDLIELNEAFAAQCLGCMHELGLSADDPRINPNGGAIALGHPLGMSGARLVLTAANELQRRKAEYALCTMCIGVGQGIAVILQRQ